MERRGVPSRRALRVALERCGVDGRAQLLESGGLQQVLVEAGLPSAFHVIVPAIARQGDEARIEATEKYWNLYPGGRVPLPWEEAQLIGQRHYEDPDSPGLLLVAGAPGIDELADEIEGYHRVLVENERQKKLEVVRIDDDLVAGLEYAIEELEERPAPPPTGTRLTGSRQRQATKPRGWVRV